MAKPRKVRIASVEEQPPEWWSTDEYRTPWEVVDAIAQAHGFVSFNLDPCARDEEAAKGLTYFPPEWDGLAQPWGPGRVWVNPPYSNPGVWVKKAAEEIKCEHGPDLIVMLLPPAIDTGWFHDYIYKKPGVEADFRRDRIAFLKWDGQPVKSPRQGNMVVTFRRLP